MSQVNIPELSPLPQMGSGNTVGTPTASTGGGGLKTTLHIPDMAADVAVTLGTPVKAGQRSSAGPGHDGYQSAAPVRPQALGCAGRLSTFALRHPCTAICICTLISLKDNNYGQLRPLADCNMLDLTALRRTRPAAGPGSPRVVTSLASLQAGDGASLSMDALLGASPEADDPLGLGLPGRLQPLTMAGVQSGSPLSPVVALHNALLTPLSFAMPQVRARTCV